MFKPKKSSPKSAELRTVDDVFLDMMFKGRFGDMRYCPKCWEKPSYSRIKQRKGFSCSYCGNQIYPLGNTAFHKSTTPAHKWIFAYFLVVENPSITSEKLQSYLGVTYKTAWRMRSIIKAKISRKAKS